MKAKLLAAATAALTMLFSVNAVSAATYTFDIDYNLLDGTYNNTGFSSQEIPVSLPTLHTGDVIDVTINFTRGLALTLNAPGIQYFNVTFWPNPSPPSGIVTNGIQLSLLHAHGDLTSDVVTGLTYCATCVAGVISGNFTDTSFSFRGLSEVITVLNIPDKVEPFGSDRMDFSVLALLGGSLEVTHGASGNPVDPVPLPTALPLFATGLVGLGLLGWRRKRKANAA